MLKNKTVLVTGGSRGIGAAIALKLSELGADIAVIYAGNRDAAEKVCLECRKVNGVKAQAYCCDVSDFEATKRTVAAVKNDFGSIHILVNNAGITRDGLIAVMSEENFDSVIATNLKGAFNMIRQCTGIFIKTDMTESQGDSPLLKMIPLGRMGECEDVAEAAAYLACVKYVTGEILRVDGGIAM